MQRILGLLLLTALLLAVEGCTSRSLTITTNPPGAEVSVNYRVIGLSPIRVGFTHYGTYRIEIRKEKFATLIREECIRPPAYGYDPITVVTDNIIPARLNDDIYLHFALKTAGDVSERSALLQRAENAANGIGTNTKGESVQLAYSRPPKTPEQLERAAKSKGLTPGTVVTPGTDTVKKPDEFIVKPIDVQVPEGPTIGKDLNIKPVTPEKKPDAPKPLEPRKEQLPPRVPKSEELIFEKPDAPKAPATPTTPTTPTTPEEPKK